MSDITIFVLQSLAGKVNVYFSYTD